jgi:hypothetical protein
MLNLALRSTSLNLEDLISGMKVTSGFAEWIILARCNIFALLRLLPIPPQFLPKAFMVHVAPQRSSTDGERLKTENRCRYSTSDFRPVNSKRNKIQKGLRSAGDGV